MIEWYRTVFEAEVVHQDPALVFMTYDDEHHRFAFANLSLLKPEAKEGDRGDFGVNPRSLYLCRCWRSDEDVCPA